MNHTWSFSSLQKFEQCPRAFYHKYVLKEKEPESEAMRKGNEFDKAVEARLKDNIPLPKEYHSYDTFAESLARMKGSCQLYTQVKLGITKDFEPSAFFGRDVWGRGALDVALVSKPTALIVDWKTGKNSEGKDYSDKGLQLKIFSLLMFKNFPGVEKITAFNLWLKTREIGKPWVFSRADEPALWREVLVKVMALEKAFEKEEWVEKPSGLCGFCPVKQCQFNRS